MSDGFSLYAARETDCACALLKAGEGMDGEVRRLCRALLGHALRSPSEGDLLLTSLQLPDKMAGWSDKMREKVVRKLTLVTFDLLLLRKWAWFGSWRSHTPLSPLCWCRGYCYECHSSGREREGNRLKSALATFSGEFPNQITYNPLPLSLL